MRELPDGAASQYYNMLLVQWIKSKAGADGRYNILITVKDQPGAYRVISIQDIEKVNQQTLDSVFANLARTMDGNAIMSDNKMRLLQQQFQTLRLWERSQPEVYYFPGDCSKFGDSVQPELLVAMSMGLALDEGLLRQCTRDFVYDFQHKRIILPRRLAPFVWEPRDEESKSFKANLEKAAQRLIY